MIDPWRARHFGTGYSAEFLPPGQHSWRIVKSGGVPMVFLTAQQAREAGKNAYLQRVEGSILSTVQRPADEQEARIEAKLKADAEQFLVSRRADVKAAHVEHRPGKRPLTVLTGRVA